MSSLSNNDDEYSSLLLCSGVGTCEGGLDAGRLVKLGDRTGVSIRTYINSQSIVVNHVIPAVLTTVPLVV